MCFVCNVHWDASGLGGAACALVLIGLGRRRRGGASYCRAGQILDSQAPLVTRKNARKDCLRGGQCPSSTLESEKIASTVLHLLRTAEQRAGFRDGYSVIVECVPCWGANSGSDCCERGKGDRTRKCRGKYWTDALGDSGLELLRRLVHDALFGFMACESRISEHEHLEASPSAWPFDIHICANH